MKLGLAAEPAIQALSGDLAQTLRNWDAAIGVGFNKEHDTDTNRHSTITATGSISERGRSVAMGDWINVLAAAVTFAGSSAAWTVGQASITTLRYMLIGHSLTYTFFLSGTSVTAGSGSLKLPLPPGFKAAYGLELPFFYVDNGTLGTGFARIFAGETTVSLFTATAANWAASASATLVAGQLTIEIT